MNRNKEQTCKADIFQVCSLFKDTNNEQIIKLNVHFLLNNI